MKLMEYSLYHIAYQLTIFRDDALEYYLTPEDYISYYESDLSKYEDLRKWLLKMKELAGYPNAASLNGKVLYQRSLYCLIAGSLFIPEDIYIPGVDDKDFDSKGGSYTELYISFLTNIWNVVFNEPLWNLPTDLFIERIDEGFVTFPNNPKRWSEPKYGEILSINKSRSHVRLN